MMLPLPDDEVVMVEGLRFLAVMEAVVEWGFLAMAQHPPLITRAL